MIETLPGSITTYETRRESHEKLNKEVRYTQILDILKGKQLTAYQIAKIMYEKGYVKDINRNHSSPRLTELMLDGRVETIGKTKCEYSGKNVSVFRIRAVEPRQTTIFEL